MQWPSIVEDLVLDLNSVVIPYLVLPQKVKHKLVWWLQGEVLALQGATTNCVCLVLALFIASSQHKLVDKVKGCNMLPVH